MLKPGRLQKSLNIHLFTFCSNLWPPKSVAPWVRMDFIVLYKYKESLWEPKIKSLTRARILLWLDRLYLHRWSEENPSVFSNEWTDGLCSLLSLCLLSPSMQTSSTTPWNKCHKLNTICKLTNSSPAGRLGWRTSAESPPPVRMPLSWRWKCCCWISEQQQPGLEHPNHSTPKWCELGVSGCFTLTLAQPATRPGSHAEPGHWNHTASFVKPLSSACS